MKIAALSHSYKRGMLANIGDWIQTISVEQHLPRIDFYLDRENLHSYDGEECIVVMNAWFSHFPENWPPSKSIIPIFHGFHMSDPAAQHFKNHIEYFKKHEPIGCRDRGTMEILNAWGVKTYLSFCCTLTFPERDKQPDNDHSVIVFADAPRIFQRPKDRPFRIRVQHEIPPVSPMAQRVYAAELLNFYRDQASEIVTSRIHAAMPCLAMGIPTLFVGKLDRRTNLLRDIGIPERHLVDMNKLSNRIRVHRPKDEDFFRGPLRIGKEISERLHSRLKEYI